MDDLLGFLAILILAAAVLFVAFAVLHIVVFLGVLILVLLLPWIIKGFLEKPRA